MTSNLSDPASPFPMGKVQKIDRLAEYQANGIVSTRVLQRPVGNITFFAFDAGQELTEHTTPFNALITVYDGEASVKVGETWNTLKTGDGIVLPANVPHAVKAVTRFKMMLTMLRG